MLFPSFFHADSGIATLMVGVHAATRIKTKHQNPKTYMHSLCKRSPWSMATIQKKNFRWSLQISDVVGSRNTSWRPQPLSSELIVLTLNYVLRFFHAVCGLWVPVGPSRLLLSIFRRFCWKRRSEWLQSWQLTGKYSRIVHFPKYITSVLPKWNPNFSRLPYRLSSEVIVKDASQHI